MLFRAHVSAYYTFSSCVARLAFPLCEMISFAVILGLRFVLNRPAALRASRAEIHSRPKLLRNRFEHYLF